MHYKHIVFDVDGTLVDTEHDEICCLQQVIREIMGVERPYDELKIVFGTTGRFGLKKLGYSSEEVDILYPHWFERSTASIGAAPLFLGVRELLDKLKTMDCTLGVVTSRERKTYDLGAEPNEFAQYFSIAICMEDTQKHKPNPEPLLEYLKQAHAEAAHTLYIGDSSFDMQCAASAGVASALALWGTQDKNLPATYKLKTPAELLQIL